MYIYCKINIIFAPDNKCIYLHLLLNIEKILVNGILSC